MNRFSFTLLSADPRSRARAGRLVTPHGVIDTPNFVFCATKGAIKGLSMEATRRAGAGVILANTYHLMLRPGAETVARLGGLHRMTGWPGPLLTDSGGYQVFSMQGAGDELQGKGQKARPNTVRDISEDGVRFRSYLDGGEHLLTPESSMRIQRALGADLVMAFDECTALHHSHDYTARSLSRTHRWALRCLEEQERLERQRRDMGDAAPHPQALYGIIQGGVFRDLREEAAQFIASRPFFGTAFGGCYGKTKDDLYEMLEWAAPYLSGSENAAGSKGSEGSKGSQRVLDPPGPRPRPVHLLGVGDIDDIFRGVRCGVDTFDCVQPTRLGRHGFALMPGQKGGRLNLRNARHAQDTTPLDPENHHPPTAGFARGYIHHLIKSEELLGIQILVEHNVAVMTRLMREIRAAIPEGGLDALEKRWIAA